MINVPAAHASTGTTGRRTGARGSARWLLCAVALAMAATRCGGGGGGAAETPPPADGTSTRGVDWVAVPGNPLVTHGPALSWRSVGAGDPALLVGPGDALTVWFTTVGIAADGHGGFTAQGPWIGRATGTAGAAPRLVCNPEAPVVPEGAAGTWDRYAETPSVLRDPNRARLLMWYLGYSAKGGSTGFVAPAIGQMVSTDSSGSGWTRPAAPIYRPTPGAWDGALVTGPTVVRGPDGIWRLYYSGLGTRPGVGLLTSTDLVTWRPHAGNPVFEPVSGAWDDAVLEQTVIHSHGRFLMWYSGFANPLSASTRIAIGLATSTDGIHWQRHPGNPVLKPGAAGTWNDLRVLAPEVRELADGSLLMAAYGMATTDAETSAGSTGLWRSSGSDPFVAVPTGVTTRPVAPGRKADPTLRSSPAASAGTAARLALAGKSREDGR
jgi:hypothetical protein